MESSVATRRVTRNPAVKNQTFAVLLTRLAKVGESAGLILVQVDSGEGKTPARIGALTDAALRGRLSHFDLHSANEVATIRQALKRRSGDNDSLRKLAQPLRLPRVLVQLLRLPDPAGRVDLREMRHGEP